MARQKTKTESKKKKAVKAENGHANSARQKSTMAAETSTRTPAEFVSRNAVPLGMVAAGVAAAAIGAGLAVAIPKLMNRNH